MSRAPNVLILASAVGVLVPALVPPRTRAVEPSPAYRESLRRTLELRKQRRGTRTAQPVGAIVPFPFPPVLIIRQTPEVHGEIGDFLSLLRR